MAHFKSFLIKYLNFARHSLNALRLFGASVIPVLAAYLLFVFLDQGQDILIITIFDLRYDTALMGVLLLGAWSLLLWYPARMLSGTENKFKIEKFYQQFFPRLIGFNAIVVIHTAFFVLPFYLKAFNAHIPKDHVWIYGFIYVLWHNGIFFTAQLVLNYWKRLNNSAGKRSIIFLSMSVMGIIPWIWVAVILCRRLEVELWEWKGILFCCCLILLQSGLFILQLWRHRRREIHPRPQVPVIEQFVHWQIRHRLVSEDLKEDQAAYGIYLLAFLSVTCVAACSWISPKFATTVGPLYTPLASLALIAGVVSFNKSVFIHRQSSFLFNYIILIFLILSMKSQFFVSRNMEIPYEIQKSMRIDAKDALIQRVNRIAELDTSEHPVAYIVLSDGGASRSGYWATCVLNALNKELDGKLPDRILMMSSTSGGSVGNGVFYRLMAEAGNKKDASAADSIAARCDRFFEGDFLSHTLATMLIPDFTMMSSLYGYDRGHALAKAMNLKAEKEGFNLSWFDSASYQKNYVFTPDLPLLFFNSCTMNEGMPAVVSNVRIQPSYTSRIDVLLREDHTTDYSIPFSDAMILSSRFPFVSPGGKLGKNYYVDGGYFDNSGAGIVLDLLQTSLSDTAVKKALEKVDLRIIHITNNTYNGPYLDASGTLGKYSKEPAAYVNNYAAPIVTVLNTYSSQTSESNELLKRWFSFYFHKGKADSLFFHNLNLYEEMINKNREAFERREYQLGFPVSWVISDYNRMRMREQIDNRKIENIANHTPHISPENQ